MRSIARSSSGRPEPVPTRCHHSREAFDCGFRCINERRDLTSDAKLVYACLVSQRRQKARGRPAPETQAEIGDAVGMSRHRAHNAICQLVAVGLVESRRHGQGRPNTYTLRGVSEEDLAGKSAGPVRNHPVRQQDAGQSGQPKIVLNKEKRIGIGRRFNTPNSGTCYGCGGPHPTQACQKYAGQIKT